MLTQEVRREAIQSAIRNPQSTIEPAVVCRGITKVFGQGESQVRALAGIDVEMAAGELTLLVGPSGCGKTTLISVIAGLLDPTEGEVAILGTNLTRLSGRQKVRFRSQNIGFVFQQYNLLPALTAAENASGTLVIAGWSRKAAVAKAADLLGRLGLGERAPGLPA